MASAPLFLLCLLVLAPVRTVSQGNACPPPPNASVAQRSCGGALCFSGAFGDNGVLQRAPARSAYYGATGVPIQPNVPVSLTLIGSLENGTVYNKTFTTTSMSDGTWKVLLDPMPTGGALTATVTCCGGAKASVSQQTFGEVLVFTGQSNQGTGSPLAHNFARNSTYHAIAGGAYSRIALWSSPDNGGVPFPREELGNWVTPTFSGFQRLVPSLQTGQLDGFASMPLLTAMALYDLWVEAEGVAAPPMAVYATAVGGTNLEAWAPYTAAAGCVNATCMCMDNWVQSCDVYTPLSNRSYCGCNGMLFARQIQPLVNTTIGAILFWQGENACMFTGGNSALGTGYGCVLPRMLSAWRDLWSVVPETTSTSVPFGVVLLADGTDSGFPGNLGNINRALTANYGRLPNELMPNTFLASAFDVGDPWMSAMDGDKCATLQCCVDSWIPLGPECHGDFRGLWTNLTGNAGSEHPRTKDIIARRLAQSLYVTAYAPPTTPLLATGPILSGCAMSGSTLTLSFDTAALKGESVQVMGPTVGGGRPLDPAFDNTALYVLVNNTLPADAGSGAPTLSDNRVYTGPYSFAFQWPDYTKLAPGNEMGVTGWVAVMPIVGPRNNQISIDTSTISGTITAVRYATGGGGDGYFLNETDGGRVCCGPLVDTHREPCPPESCPLKATGRLTLPVVPFVARILDGKCECLAPQTCDEEDEEGTTAPSPWTTVAAAPAVASSATPLNLVVLPQPFADSFGARCLDGSPPASYRLVQDPTRWIVFIEGGGWCFTNASCATRALGGGGSSHGLPPTMDVGGLLSPNVTINPRFASYSFAFIKYCDGSSHSSNATEPEYGGVKVPQMWHRGRPNLAAQISHLLSAAGMSNASDVILSGGSAGGTSVFLGLDYVATLLPPTVRLVGAPDAGFFIDAPTWQNSTDHFFQQEFMSGDAQWNSTGSGSLNTDCLAAFAGSTWKCFFPENSAPYIHTPWHAMMSSYDLASLSMILGVSCLPPSCGSAELAAILEWRAPFLAALRPAIASYPYNGAFIDSCLVHEQNVDYCSGQSEPNCRGWNIYEVTAPGYAPNLTPQAGFSVWYDSISQNWAAVSAARSAWRERVRASIAGGPDAYPRNASSLDAAQIVIIDPNTWPGNPSCPYGKNKTD